MKKQLILASASPRRKILLERLGLEFEIIESNFNENLKLMFVPKKLAQELALGKAKAVAEKMKSSGVNNKHFVIIAADTIVEFSGEILGKPHTKINAKIMLKKLSGKTHLVHTGLAVLDVSANRKLVSVETTKVKFRTLGKNEILNYVQSGEPLDKAGAYAIQETAGVFVEKIWGDYNNIVGLPIAKLAKMLKRVGFKI